MATIKSFTDLSQSKTLRKILPLESADMYYWLAWSGGVSEEERNTPKVGTPNKNAIKTYWCPCWSLAALIDVLPNGIVMNKDSQNGRYHFSSTYIRTYVTADNPIDACVAMIEKLNELKIL